MPERFLSQAALAELAGIPAVSRWVTNRGQRIHVLDYGGDLPPAVFIAGITSPAVTLDFVVRRVRDQVRPIVVDLRGRGLSDDGVLHSLESHADDLNAVIGGLKLDRPLMVGHSMGAGIVAFLAAASADAARGSILVDPPLSGPRSGPYPTPLAVFETQLDEAYAGTTAQRVAEHWPRWPVAEQRLRALWLSSCGREAVAATHRSFESVEFAPIWQSLDARTSLIYGEESAVVSGEAVGRLALQNPSPAIVKVAGSGHMVFWDSPEGGLAALRDETARLLSAETSTMPKGTI
ncbi:MAG TPA: alpha/beta hydrolase [Chloroflexi bacterium]|nr:alpha/beta hydrolase [Chloroflexota bacterium]